MSDFVNAILIIKATPSPYSDTLSYYDTFVRFYQMAVHNVGHDWVTGFFEIPVANVEMIPVSTFNPYCGEVTRDNTY